MKKVVLWLVILTLTAALFISQAAFAADGELVLPEKLVRIEDEAFIGDISFDTVVIPKNVKYIGSKAFANCTNLTQVRFEFNTEIEIAPNAFEGCEETIQFVAYADTPPELFALSKGFICDYADSIDTFARAKNLVKEHGGVESTSQDDFDSMRLIVRRNSNRLPDISAFNPTAIFRKGDVFVIQFSEASDARNCWGELKRERRERNDNGESGDYEEPDKVITATFSSDTDEVQAAGVMFTPQWDTDDPMGFDTYAPFIAQNGQNSCKIAVIDTGIRYDPSYGERLCVDEGASFVPDDDTWFSGEADHGSYISSVINECCGTTNVHVYILPIRAVDNNGGKNSGNTDTLLFGDAIYYAVEKGANIINLSQNFDSSEYVKNAIMYAINSGCTVVVAAGNSGANTADVFPANVPGVVTVAGLDQDYKIRGNRGSEVQYCAPFGAFETALGLNQGTSFSAPMIASALALVSLDPYHDLLDMDNTCFLPNETGTDNNSYGKGMPRLNLLANIPVTSIAIDSNIRNIIGIGKDDTELKWTVGPDNATNKTVTVTSSNPAVLAVVKDELSGKVYARGVSAGTATLTFRAESGVSVTKDFQVDQPVETITILGSNNKLPVGRTMQLTTSIAPSNATNKTIVWSSSDTSKATVSQSGLVIAKKSGSVTITATAQDGFRANKSITIQIVDQPDAEEVVLSIAGQAVPATLSLKPNETAQLTATVRPADADQSVTFDSSNKAVAVVSSTGLITAQSSGSTTITVTSADEKASTTLNVTVLVMPTSVAISGPSAVNQGATISLTATVSPDNAYDRSVRWESDNPSIARVDSTTGVVTGVSGGSTTIRAYAKGDQTKYGTKQITVRAQLTLNFDVNAKNADGSTDTSAVASYTSKTVYNGGTIGSLPTATRDYYAFNGWWTAANGGTQITESSVASSSIAKLYAHWTLNAESDWVLPSEVPADAMITDTSYSYRESIESPTADNPGWIADGWFWKEDGTRTKHYAYFPSGYDTGNSYYTEYRHEPFPAFENETSKCEVTNVQDGWIYWHWMYNKVYEPDSAYDLQRAISSMRGNFTPTSTTYAFIYFYAMPSTIDCPYLGTGYCCNQNIPSYNARQVIDQFASSSDRNSGTSGLGTSRFFRFERYKSIITDYVKRYKYYRDMEYQHEDPGSGSEGITITDKVTYVKYRMKYGSISNWSETKPVGVDERLIQTKTQYHYSDKETTTSSSQTLNGWIPDGTTQVWSEYGPWSGWSTDMVSESDSCQVETTPMYRYYYYYCPKCGRHEPLTGQSDCSQYSLSSSNWNAAWFPVAYSNSSYQRFSYTSEKYYTTSLGDGQTWCFSAGNLNDTAIGTTDADSSDTVIILGYRYRTRTQETQYNFYRWADWSPWSDTVYTASDGRRVETRTLYRYVIS